MKPILAALLLCFLTACASTTPLVHIQPIIEANKKTQTAIKATTVHQKQLTESQVKVGSSLEKVMNDLNQLVISPLVLDAKAQLEVAQAEQKHSQELAAWAVESNQQAWDFAAQTGEAAEVAKGEAQKQADEVAKMLPVYKAVTRWFSLGAFVWGTQQLLKHLIILALFGTGLMLVFWGLTFAFPFLLPAFRIVTGFLTRILQGIEHRIARK